MLSHGLALLTARFPVPQEKVEKFGTQTPVNRAAMPKEYGPAFVFLACNEDSSMVCGEVPPRVLDV